MHSLRLRLLLTLIGVVAVAVASVALFASRVTSLELQRYVELDVQRNRLLTDKLMTYYTHEPTGDSPESLASRLAGETSERIILTNGDGLVQADSTGQLVGQTIGCEQPIPGVIISVGGTPCKLLAKEDPLDSLKPSVGDILFLGVPFSYPAESAMLSNGASMKFEAAVPAVMASKPAVLIRRVQGQSPDPIEAGFISAVNRSLVWSAVAAGLTALLLTLALSRRILGPSEALTAAARAMERGDLSRRVHARSNDEIGELAQAFNAMADGLARQERLRRTMVGDVAHELRTPLTNIRGYLEALRDGVAKPEPALLTSLHDEALLLNRLVDDLQELTLAEAGQLHLDPRPVELREIVDQLAVALQPALDQKELALSAELPCDLPQVQADPERVSQVLRNLLNNAITHTPEGGSITLCAVHETKDQRPKTKDQHIGLEPLVFGPSSFVTIRVSDSGPGIAPEHLANIFERFYRADRSRARATGGAGLGLAIVKQLVEAHGGRVWAASETGQGTCISFTLPTAPAELHQSLTSS
ncbi:MAG TPA: ATP-binding protein [Roseiflexaceae bacterium]|nr:ATP-binding protein [Roseiflexaceae bacterium]